MEVSKQATRLYDFMIQKKEYINALKYKVMALTWRADGLSQLLA